MPPAEKVVLPGAGLSLVADRWEPAGRSKGTVVLLHGGGQTRHSWRRTGVRLAAGGWTAIAVDSRGHGESDWAPDGSYGIDDLVGDVLALVAHLGEPPVLAGASMGGLSSLTAVGENPAIARGLVLVDIVPRVEASGAAEIAGFMRSGSDGFATLEDAAAAIAAYTPHRTREVNLDGLRKNLRLRDGRWHWHWDPAMLRRSGNPASAPPGAPSTYGRTLAAAARVTVPTLVVRGGFSRVVSTDGMQELLALIPQAEAIDVADAGHMIAGDDNDVFAVRLVDFLDLRVAGGTPPQVRPAAAAEPPPR